MAGTELDDLITLLGTYAFPEHLPIERHRQNFEGLMSHFQVADHVSIEEVDAGGIPSEWLTGRQVREEMMVLYIHGGGFYFGSRQTHRDVCGRISLALNAPVLSIGYRLAPEHPFPAALEDVEAAYRWVLGRNRSADQIIVAGESAGAGVALALLVMLRDKGDALPAAGVLLSPWIDLTEPLEWRGRTLYLGDTDPRTPLASPYFADLTGLPPLLVQVGTNDPLLDQARRLAQ